MSPQREYQSLEDVLAHELEDLYDAEVRIVDALPIFANAAHNHDLQNRLNTELAEAKQQLKRLEEIFNKLDRQRKPETSEALKGLVQQGMEIIHAAGDKDAKDAALIATMQKIKHYELAGYGCARNFAVRLNLQDVARELRHTLKEESSADRQLTDVAEAGVNSGAMHPAA